MRRLFFCVFISPRARFSMIASSVRRVVATSSAFAALTATAFTSSASGTSLCLSAALAVRKMKTLLRLIFGWIARLREQGLSILLAEQNARLSRAIADRGYVIENGRVKLSRSRRELLRSKEA